jgi:hypothetical protein
MDHCAGLIKLTLPFNIVSSKITKKIKGQMAYLGNFKPFGIATVFLVAARDKVRFQPTAP